MEKTVSRLPHRVGWQRHDGDGSDSPFGLAPADGFGEFPDRTRGELAGEPGDVDHLAIGADLAASMLRSTSFSSGGWDSPPLRQPVPYATNARYMPCLVSAAFGAPSSGTS